MRIHTGFSVTGLKNAALGETIFGIKTLKSLALERQRKWLWGERTAEVATGAIP